MPRLPLIGFGLLLIGFASAAVQAAPAENSQVDVLTADGSWIVPKELTLRARVTAITPAEKVDISWRHGGEGLGGDVFRGTLGEKLDVGQWSPPFEVASLVTKGKFPRTMFVSIMVALSDPGPKKTPKPLPKEVQIEFDFRYREKTIKHFTERGPNGGTVGLVIPAGRLAGGKTPDDSAFVNDLCGLLTYAQRRAETVEALPWAKQPLPKRYAILTDLGGYGENVGYGTRTTDRDVMAAEVRTLRQLGVNGLRSAPPFVLDMAAKGEGMAKDLHRARITHSMGYPIVKHDERKKTVDPEAGCPFAGGVPGRTKAEIEEFISTLPPAAADELWALTVDEIGAVFDGAPEGKRHVAICPRCAAAFREYLQQQGLKPADFGAASWEAVKPYDGFAKESKLGAVDRAQGLQAYHTSMFINYASAKLFTPLRDALAERNRETLAARKANAAAPEAVRSLVYSYALRGNTFLMGGHSLDFFDFYRHADNGFVYETSNRDPRIWQWDSYLCDVGRTVSAERGLEFGIYVKPHRGAPVQRALSAVSRNAQMLYWYTYGPDWSKGDTFASHPEALALSSKAARLIAAGEDVLYGSTWAVPAEVAVVYPRSSELWMRLSGAPPERTAAYENAKWLYLALAHEHLPVDPLDEGMLAEKSEKELARYKVIYVSGPNLTAAAAEKLAKWVWAGGVLYTSGGGLKFDEANQPLAALREPLGIKARQPVEMWKQVALYGAVGLESYDEKKRQIGAVPENMVVKLDAAPDIEIRPVVGREVIVPTHEAETLAHFADGGTAATRHPFGAGMVYIVGLFPGLEYSAPLRGAAYDMSRDFSAATRQFITLPCRGKVRPVVACNEPTVEGVLLKNSASGKLAVTLMNWAYRATPPPEGIKGAKGSVKHVPLEKVTLTIRGAGKVATVRSAALGTTLALTTAGDEISLTLPQLEEGDVLLLE